MKTERRIYWHFTPNGCLTFVLRILAVLFFVIVFAVLFFFPEVLK